MTTFADGLYQFGGQPVGSGLPPTPGNVYFVNYGTGVNAGSGKSPNSPWQTIEYAYSQVTSGQDDIIVLQGSSTHVLSAMLDVTKSRVHFIGIDGTGGRFYGNNAKVSLTATSGATNIATLKNTGVRNSFVNIKFINESTVTEGIYCVAEGGEYSLYQNCEIYKSTDLDVTGAAELLLNGDSAQFIDCTIGSLANEIVGAILRPCVLLTKNLVTASSVTRDAYFQNCMFWRNGGNAANRLVYGANATDVERMLLFKGCGFINNPQGTANPGEAVAFGATLTVGAVTLDPACFTTNITKVSGTTGVFVTGAVPTAATSSIAVNAA